MQLTVVLILYVCVEPQSQVVEVRRLAVRVVGIPCPPKSVTDSPSWVLKTTFRGKCLALVLVILARAGVRKKKEKKKKKNQRFACERYSVECGVQGIVGALPPVLSRKDKISPMDR